MFNFLSDFNRIKIILGRRRRRDIVRIVSQDSGEDAGGLDTPMDSSITFDFVVRGKIRVLSLQLFSIRLASRNSLWLILTCIILSV